MTKHTYEEALNDPAVKIKEADFKEQIKKIEEAIAKYCPREQDFDSSDRSNFIHTPIRAAKAFCYLSDRKVLVDRERLLSQLKRKVEYEREVADIVSTSFHTNSLDCGIITQGTIHATGLCPHHFLPVYYKAHVAYKPKQGGNVLGLSKMSRVVKALAPRPVLQEQLTVDIAETFWSRDGYVSDPMRIVSEGSAVQLIGHHTCMSHRGVHCHANTMTTVLRGAFEQEDLKTEFYRAIDALRNSISAD